ncbi:MAG: mannose-1-phosphate guanylyltransferase/mannose-6-phosphate isomerase [SAR324 cluster bacterium]|nr:mannose-1-phosphate guanylyltransferase/mannose-6-phosphate isomerase [SAR324 cluster bacterium]MBL7035651.1 mannose-1-phosphate guanylyltransferase/mannose-6-phosphate isomerase [SAR324 cluster bacterium]
MIAIILAGGTGTRLWPFSRSMTPKQFLNLGSTHESLFQETCLRLENLVPPEQIYVIGADSHQGELQQQMGQIYPDYRPEQLLLEPQSRNTAPAILWGILQIPENQRHEPVVILASDHLIKAPAGFISALKSAETLAASGYLVTFGIRPDRPETGYGYIKAGESLGVGFKVAEFVEKPDQATAEAYLESADYTWNASIFMATAETWLAEFRLHAAEMLAVFEVKSAAGDDLADPQVISDIYEEIAADSIDYALFEKSKNVAVLPVEMDWSDLGSWESIFQVSEKDEQGNVLRGNVVSLDTKNSLIFSSKKLVTSIGVENLIIVETDDALLVCDMTRSQDVKKLVETLKKEERHEYKFHTRVMRPWGSATTILENSNYRIRMLEIGPEKSLRLQRHQQRSEHWVVLEGTAEVQRGDETIILHQNESAYIPKGMQHRLQNSTKVPLQIIEVQQGEYLGDDDIERL